MTIIQPAAHWIERSAISPATLALWRESAQGGGEKFWAEMARILDWVRFPTQIKNVDFADQARIRWYEDGTLNASYNCIDRHAQLHPERVAIIWQGDDPAQSQHITYAQLLAEVSRLANALLALGVTRGERVVIYLPMIPQAAFAMLACARIGAVHSVVFAGFSADALQSRILDCGAKLVITADYAVRGGKQIALKANVDQAVTQCPGVKNILVVRRTGGDVAMQEGRDIWYDDLVPKQSAICPPAAMGAEDPLFVLYTSGSTGKPKGVLHTTGGYLTYAAWTHAAVFDYRPGEIYWCTADIGWVTGHSYIVYGPLANGATTMMFEGVPNYPDASRFWQEIDKHQVNIFYTAPTAIRALMREGDAKLATTTRQSLRLLGSVGEPINPEAWLWYYRAVGRERCAVIDTWWQTETGGILIAPLAAHTALKPGSATLPLPGIRPELVDANGNTIDGEGEGNLLLVDSWPGQARTLYGDHARFIETYFKPYPGKYFTGDGCRRDADGYYWITGRVDDVINVAGHRLGTAEIESAFVAHAAVAEAAVVGCPHAIKGQGIYAYVTLKNGVVPSEELRAELTQWVRQKISPIATPDFLQFAPGLPKTRSGKIMRRILRKIAEDETGNLGDISTLAEPLVVQELIDNRRFRQSGQRNNS
jgi:acetyl-CoA synthetase